MGLARVLSRTSHGLQAPQVSVEVHVGAGLPGMSIVGLPAPVVRESRERVRAALQNAGFDYPAGRITVNLAPVELAKQGGRFDLPIALGVLLASSQLREAGSREAKPRAAESPVDTSATWECYGELGLSGELKPVEGVFLSALHAGRAGHRLIVPLANLAEAVRAGHARSVGCRHLLDACRALAGETAPPEATAPEAAAPEAGAPDAAAPADPFAEVRGQWLARRALQIAAAGSHSVLLIGPPGSGKSLLASRLPLLLPPLSVDESLEVASIASVAQGAPDLAHWSRRPFRAPHHSASANAIVGGGARLAPGEISLAHRGVLFLDELPEYDRRVLEALREPLESGLVTLARAGGRLELPADFQLVAAMNPCPCGYLGDGERECRCTPRQVARYRARLSGPLLDRIDLRIDVPRVPARELLAAPGPGAGDERGPVAVHSLATQSLAGASLSEQVSAARERQWQRSRCLNARLSTRQIARHCTLGSGAEELMLRGRESLRLSARGVHRVLRVARTIADLAGTDSIEPPHLAEALQLRREPEAYFSSETR